MFCPRRARESGVSDSGEPRRTGLAANYLLHAPVDATGGRRRLRERSDRGIRTWHSGAAAAFLPRGWVDYTCSHATKKQDKGERDGDERLKRGSLRRSPHEQAHRGLQGQVLRRRRMRSCPSTNTWTCAGRILASTPPPPSAFWRRSASQNSSTPAIDQRLSRIFANRIIKRYPAFAEFYGMEDAISQIVSFFKHAAQGLEERKQILYLLGPVGGGKCSDRRASETTDGAAARSTRSRARR